MVDRKLKAIGGEVQLGELVENINDFFDRASSEAVRYVAGEHIDEGNLFVRRWGMTTDDLVPPTFNRRFQAHDVLFHSRNLAKLAVPNFDGITGEKLFVLRTKDESRLLQSFLPFLLQTDRFLDYVNSRWSGSTNKFLNKTPLMAYEFVLPSIEEQLRIVSTLSEVEANAEALCTLMHRCRTLVAAILQNYVWGSNKQIPRCPINEIAEINPSVSALNEDAPFIPMEAIDPWTQDIDLGRIEQKGTRGGVRAIGGDILMARITPCLENGKIAQVPVSIKKCGGSTELIVFRAKTGTDQQFLYNIITSSYFHSQAAGTMSGSTGRQRAAAGDVGKILVPVLPLEQQRRICLLIAEIQNRRSDVAARIKSLSRIRRALICAMEKG